MRNGEPETFWEHVYRLREKGQIPLLWRSGDLREFLEGRYSLHSIRSDPSNYHISPEDNTVGHFVKDGAAPKVLRVSRGLYQLIADPNDDKATQEAETRRSTRLAEDIMAQKEQEECYRYDAPMQVADLPEPAEPQGESETGSSGLYPSIPVALTQSEHRGLSGRVAEQKAIYIVNKHLKDKYGSQAEIEEDTDGADLRISVDGKTERIEVKGTESSTLAWPELEVSSRESHDALKKGDTSMYRVVDVSGTNPRIYILSHGEHFTLEPEPRWAVKRVPLGDDRYPLRGQPYRYDRPYDPVAEDEWEALE